MKTRLRDFRNMAHSGRWGELTQPNIHLFLMLMYVCNEMMPRWILTYRVLRLHRCRPLALSRTFLCLLPCRGRPLLLLRLRRHRLRVRLLLIRLGPLVVISNPIFEAVTRCPILQRCRRRGLLLRQRLQFGSPCGCSSALIPYVAAAVSFLRLRNL